MTTSERWLPVVGYERTYEVSDHGRIRSIDRVVLAYAWGKAIERAVKGRIIATYVDDGRPRVRLSQDGVAETRLVHQLVLEAFSGPKPEGHEVAHNDGNSTNNQLSNLRWSTHRDNMADQLAHGTRLRGTDLDHAKLTEVQVIRIRELRRRGETTIALGEAFGISQAQASRISNAKSWGWLS